MQKIVGGNGSFPSGVIQYAFTYYNKNAQESNIFYTTPLLYISPLDRGARPDEMVDNVFTIRISHVDENFDYLRIYSIQRTSLNGTPVCKRVQDLKVSEMENVTDDDPPTASSVYYRKTSFTDTGRTGNTVDPTELLYKGGESIVAKTLEQKDGTLFLGNLTVEKLLAKVTASNMVTVTEDTRSIAIGDQSADYPYKNQLTSFDSNDPEKSVPCGAFKKGNTYRLGVQFQDKYGRWSEPVHVSDEPITAFPTIDSTDNVADLRIFKGVISSSNASDLMELGYEKVRAVMAVPNPQDRAVVCQGVVNPTLYTTNHRTNNKDLYAQSSWFFRGSYLNSSLVNSDGTVAPKSASANLIYTQRNIEDDVPDAGYLAWNPEKIRAVEIEGDYSPENQYKVDWYFSTLHSPDVEFDEQFLIADLTDTEAYKVGTVQFLKTFSAIDIQTETPSIAGNAGGFRPMSFTKDGAYGIVSGLFYEDGTVEDVGTNPVTIRRLHWGANGEVEPCTNRWLVYPWEGDGSLNNDINRESNQGVPSAILKKKVISNLRIAKTDFGSDSHRTLECKPQVFSSNEVSILKFSGYGVYEGNVDTMLYPDNYDGKYFAFNSNNIMTAGIVTPLDSTVWWKTFNRSDQTQQGEGLYKWGSNIEKWYLTAGEGQDLGNQVLEMVLKRNPVRIKYKSTPHIAFRFSNSWFPPVGEENGYLYVAELRRPVTNPYGGTSQDALKENTWIPCGEPVRLDKVVDNTVTFYWSYGDTYFQRWDCLKTYPFTHEDQNQIVEIGSFMLETYVNIDGRYDRNRGQLNNTSMSPLNFNLMNNAYSQMDNFFSYKITDTEETSTKIYPNMITWTKTKESGADVDLWTNITLASTLELDGNKGELRKLIRLNDSLLAFQDTGISQILYNENVQIQSTEGVPIELANSGKVQGKRYISNTIGCSNKWSMAVSPLGIYFIDSNEKSIYLFNGELSNLSMKGGMNAWMKQQDFSGDEEWNLSTGNNFVSYYDKKNQEVLFINDRCLAYSEKFGTFTSFYNYHNAAFFCSLDDSGIWTSRGTTPPYNYCLWEHQAGDYCKFFDIVRPYWMTLVGNPEPMLDKTFTNLEFRACVTGDGSTKIEDEYVVFDKFYLPFDSFEVWDEYQHGIAALSVKNGGMGNGMHHLPNSSDAALNRKFRIWRCDVPRDNAPVNSTAEASMGITRFKVRPLDRMRNPWIYLKLMKEVEEEEQNKQTVQLPMHKVEVHDMVMSYYI